MKFKILLITFLIFGLSNIFGQYLLGYYCQSFMYSTYPTITGGQISTATGDDGSQIINLPFPFKYMGETYTTAKISTNGWFNPSANFQGLGYQNQLASATQKPILAPFWDDLFADAESEIRFEVLGQYPSRVFAVQWKNLRWRSPGPTNVRKTFQIRLHEFDDHIEFIYGPAVINTPYYTNVSYSVGLNNTTGGVNNFISAKSYDYFFSPTFSSTVANDTISNVENFREGSLINFVPRNTTLKTYQTPDSLVKGSGNQKVAAALFSIHPGAVLAGVFVTGLSFNSNGTTNLNDISNARLFYTGNSPIFNTSTQLGSTIQTITDSFVFNFSPFTIIHEDVNYFWLTFDVSPYAQTGNFVDAFCNKIKISVMGGYASSSDTSLSQAKCIIVDSSSVGVMSGDYTVGSSMDDFVNLTSALNNLKSAQIFSPIKLILKDSYNPMSEAYPLVIPRFARNSNNFSVTIVPDINCSEKIITTNAQNTIELDNAKNIVIDGRPGGIGNTSVLKISNESATGVTLNIKNNSTDNLIQYCSIIGKNVNVDQGIVFFNSSTYSYNKGNSLKQCVIAGDSTEAAMNCILFIDGNSYNDSVNISHCTIKNFKSVGISIPSATGKIYVEDCEIYNDAAFLTESVTGIVVGGSYGIIKRTKIYNLSSLLTASNVVCGIKIKNSYYLELQNNFISLMGNDHSHVLGINVDMNSEIEPRSGQGNKIYNNTVLIYGINLNDNESNAFGLFGNSGIDLKNNIFINSRQNISGSAKNLAIGIMNAWNISLGYNNYFVTPPNEYFGRWNNSYSSNINHWYQTTQIDTTSISRDVEFISNTDLHLSGNSLGDTNLAATPLADVTDDIDREPRSQNYPYMGADENLNNPLPVELVSFTFERMVNKIKLEWVTASEINNLGFIIERQNKILVEKNWQAIGFVESKGNSTEINQYSFIDEKLQDEKMYYRLKQLDKDGAIHYSQIIEVENILPDKYVLHLNYPNPFNSVTVISYELPALSKVRLTVYDILGNVVAKLVDEEKLPGRHEVQFDASSLSSGIYFYRLQAGNFIETKKMILMR